MARNYAAYYNSANDSTALEQAFYIKKEGVRGTYALPEGTDFFNSISGGAINFSQPAESSPARSGRHNLSSIKDKKVLDWNIPAYINIDTLLPSADEDEVDAAVKTLWESALGRATLVSGAVFDSAAEPSITFSIFEVGDRWSKQARGCVVDSATLQLPGDGRAQVEFTGFGIEALLVGIGKSTVSNTGNAITLQAGEGKRFPKGAQVMIVESDGVTRSADTPDDTARTVVSVVGDIVTLSGAALTDVDGSTTPIFLCYYEPVGKAAINNPQTGLQGSVTIVGLGSQCVRSLTLTLANNHERIDYCYGHDAVDNKVFVPAGRLDVNVTMEMNLNAALVSFYNSVQAFESKNITAILGDAAGRHLKLELPKVEFAVPAISVPETGSIPVSFEGMAYQTALDAADEVKVSYL